MLLELGLPVCHDLLQNPVITSMVINRGAEIKVDISYTQNLTATAGDN